MKRTKLSKAVSWALFSSCLALSGAAYAADDAKSGPAAKDRGSQARDDKARNDRQVQVQGDRFWASDLIGRNVKQTDHTRLSVFGGLVGAREHYTALLGKPQTTNADGLVGMDFFTFRFSKTDIRSRLSVFPSLTTPGRMRVQATSDLRIKIVKDLWWGFHLYENFDSKPPVAADKNDLGVSTSVGWKF